MEAPKWSDSLSVGVDLIDGQHKQLFAIFDDLCVAIAQDEGDKALKETFLRLEGYVRNHFSDEEAYMREIGYPDLDDHISQHEQLLLRFKMLWNRSRKNQPVQAGGVAHFLNEWIVEHISASDRLIGEFAANQG